MKTMNAKVQIEAITSPGKSKMDAMERDKFIPIALFLTVLAVLPKMECQLRPRPTPLSLPLPPPRPLCTSQFLLVNYACAFLPYSPAPPVSPPPPHPHHPPPKHPHPPPKHPHHDGDDEDDNDNNDDDELEHHHHYESRHRHRHRHRHSSDKENCCRWLKEVDSDCVCDLLVYLPVFLAKPAHEYTVVVDDICSITYTCNGRLRP